MSLRIDKVASVVQKDLGLQMQQLELPFLSTISKVEVTPDLKHAKVWITVFPSGKENEEKILEILDKNMYDLQGNLNKNLFMKVFPRIHFKIDTSEEYSSKINDLIQRTHDSE